MEQVGGDPARVGAAVGKQLRRRSVGRCSQPGRDRLLDGASHEGVDERQASGEVVLLENEDVGRHQRVSGGRGAVRAQARELGGQAHRRAVAQHGHGSGQLVGRAGELGQAP